MSVLKHMYMYFTEDSTKCHLNLIYVQNFMKIDFPNGILDKEIKRRNGRVGYHAMRRHENAKLHIVPSLFAFLNM